MDAIAGRALAPMFLHPLQHGGWNRERAYVDVVYAEKIEAKVLSKSMFVFITYSLKVGIYVI